mmetsp:Transcript_8167/g.30696  ORF Transcript_8167/g.30696 Transcript_8167/m.30696 type:complete len:431 (+) Transcript_8167:979-2271(+)
MAEDFAIERPEQARRLGHNRGGARMTVHQGQLAEARMAGVRCHVRVHGRALGRLRLGRRACHPDLVDAGVRDVEAISLVILADDDRSRGHRHLRHDVDDLLKLLVREVLEEEVHAHGVPYTALLLFGLRHGQGLHIQHILVVPIALLSVLIFIGRADDLLLLPRHDAPDGAHASDLHVVQAHGGARGLEAFVHVEVQRNHGDVVRAYFEAQPEVVGLLHAGFAGRKGIGDLVHHVSDRLVGQELKNAVGRDYHELVVRMDLAGQDLRLGEDSKLFGERVADRPGEGGAWVVAKGRPDPRRVAAFVEVLSQVDVSPVFVHRRVAFDLVHGHDAGAASLHALALVLPVRGLVAAERLRHDARRVLVPRLRNDRSGVADVRDVAEVSMHEHHDGRGAAQLVVNAVIGVQLLVREHHRLVKCLGEAQLSGQEVG